MKACITMNNQQRAAVWLERLLVTAVILALWQGLTLFFPPIVVPGVPSVISKLAAILSDPACWRAIKLTAWRLIWGLGLGIFLGGVLGLIFGLSRRAERIFSPILRIFQTVPPVCWVVLALVWFGFNDKPCVFIVVTATLPIVTINLAQGVKNIDPKLIEMAKMYGFSRRAIFAHVMLPSIMPSIRSALEIVVSGGWKIAVMAEVLTTSTGIGGAINTARLNIEPETLIAWAVILVGLCYLTQGLVEKLFLRRKEEVL